MSIKHESKKKKSQEEQGQIIKSLKLQLDSIKTTLDEESNQI